jgi:2-iminobutanoate/2-iminopropanoate deaminase
MKEVFSEEAMSAKGLLSQAIISADLVFTAGFIHMTADGQLTGETVDEKLAQVMKNIKEVLESAGSSLEKVVKATIYVTDLSIGAELNQSYVKYFSDPMPVREMVQVSALPLGASVEISVVAEL